MREGLNPRNIVVIQNLIVDVLNHYYFDRKDEYEDYANDAFFAERGIERDEFYLMTCHRRESVEAPEPLQGILDLIAQSPSTRSTSPPATAPRSACKEFGLTVPDNTIMVDPIGYKELLALLGNSRGAITDSGTVVEETAVIGVPSLQMRKATERPQVYDCGSSVKFDPARPEDYPAETVLAKLEALHGKKFDHRLGDGHASERLVEDLVRRVTTTRSAGTGPRTRTSTSRAPTARTACRSGVTPWPSMGVVVPVYNEEAGLDAGHRGHPRRRGGVPGPRRAHRGRRRQRRPQR